MIYNNQGGKIGFSSSKKNQKKNYLLQLNYQFQYYQILKIIEKNLFQIHQEKNQIGNFKQKNFQQKQHLLFYLILFLKLIPTLMEKFLLKNFVLNFKTLIFHLILVLIILFFQLKKYQIQQKQN